MERRNFLQSLGLGSVAGLIPLSAKQAMATHEAIPGGITKADMEEALRLMPKTPHDLYKDMRVTECRRARETEQIAGIDPHQCHMELVRYADAVRRYQEAHPDTNPVFKCPAAFSVPFATETTNFYVRNPDDVGYEPDLTALRRYLEVEDVPHLRDRPLRDVFRRYAHRLFAQEVRWSKEVEELKKPRKEVYEAAKRDEKALALPNRIVTPRYTIDQAELNNYSLASLILNAARGLVCELTSKLDAALKAWAEGEHWERNATIVAHHMPPDCTVHRDGFMFDFIFWIVAQGVLVPPGKEVVHESCNQGEIP